MIELSNHHYKSKIEPSAGCAVLALQYNGVNIFRPCPSVEALQLDPREAACFPCVPYFGRLPSGFSQGGPPWNLTPTLPACDNENALHGEGWIMPWETLSITKDVLICSAAYIPRPGGYPFSFEATQSFSISEKSFSISLTILNTAREPIPVGLGLHPFFDRHEETRVKFTATELWIPPNEDNGRQTPIPDEWDFSYGRALPNETLDHSFIGTTSDVVISQRSGDITLSSNTNLLHVYAPENEPYFCLEPITHRPGQFGDDYLSPGQSKTLTMAITVG
ncbi:MAG: aldose 1-epimerase [Hyphococcus sp.]|nr:MAG: aldose 1-epimerase [Marinicaulis sp.]